MNNIEKWSEWAIELQNLAQAGLTYGRDIYDKERYERTRDISAEISPHKVDTSIEKVKDLFCNETGYQTPKLGIRVAIFENGKVLPVKENNGKRSLSGGWVDVNISVKENTIREVEEEAGSDVSANKMTAVQDRTEYSLPVYAYGVCKVFVPCSVLGGQFQENIETTEFKYFNEDETPKSAEEENTIEQVKMCFKAYKSESWETILD